MKSMIDTEHLCIVDAEAVQLVRDYMLYPEDHMRHPKRFSNSIINFIDKSFVRSKRQQKRNMLS